MRALKYILVCFALVSCASGSEKKEKHLGEVYNSSYQRGFFIEILKIRDCEYVLWHNSYGSDMEHYEGCENPKHNTSK